MAKARVPPDDAFVEKPKAGAVLGTAGLSPVGQLPHTQSTPPRPGRRLDPAGASSGRRPRR